MPTMTYREINLWLRSQKIAMTSRHREERSELYARHEAEREALMEQWEARMLDFQGAKEARQASPDALTAHNREMALQAFMDKLRIEYNMPGAQVPQLTTHILRLLKSISNTYVTQHLDPANTKRFHKNERELRQKLSKLGLPVEQFPVLMYDQKLAALAARNPLPKDFDPTTHNSDSDIMAAVAQRTLQVAEEHRRIMAGEEPKVTAVPADDGRCFLSDTEAMAVTSDDAERFNDPSKDWGSFPPVPNDAPADQHPPEPTDPLGDEPTAEDDEGDKFIDNP